MLSESAKPASLHQLKLVEDEKAAQVFFSVPVRLILLVVASCFPEVRHTQVAPFQCKIKNQSLFEGLAVEFHPPK
jgi:hypothetical protein